MAEAVGLARKFHDVPFVRKPPDQCVRHFLILEYIILPLSLIVLLDEAIRGAVSYLLLSSIPSKASL